MSLLNYMKESMNCIESTYQKYATNRGKFSDKVLYCFFEGKDDPKYYINRIEKFTSKEIISYPCGKRDNVYKVHGMIESKKSTHNNTLYFTDRDFNINIIKNEDIYSTPCYAIENFYILDSVFEKIINYELGISKFSYEKEDIEDFKKLMEYYKSEKGKFIESTKYLNAWYALQINKSRLIEEKCRPKLDKLKEIKESYYPYNNIETLEGLTKNYVKVTKEEIDKTINELIKNPEYNFRGKYYIYFLCKVLNYVFSESNKPSGFLSKKRKVSLGIASNSIISTFCQYAATPTCLDEYLKYKIQENIQNQLEVG